MKVIIMYWWIELDKFLVFHLFLCLWNRIKWTHCCLSTWHGFVIWLNIFGINTITQIDGWRCFIIKRVQKLLLRSILTLLKLQLRMLFFEVNMRDYDLLILRRHFSDLCNLLFNVRRSILDEEILSRKYLCIKLRYPSPQLVIFDPIFGFKLTKIRYNTC
jgi:hypothetical protein